MRISAISLCVVSVLFLVCALAPSAQATSALEFDGQNDFVEIPLTASLDGTAAFTSEAWIRPLDTSGGGVVGIWGEGGIPDKHLLHFSSGLLVGRIARSGIPGHTTVTAPIAANVWSHVALTYDSSFLRLYINGVEVAAVAAPGSLEPLAGLAVDAKFGIDELALLAPTFFRGTLDDVRMWNVARSAEEIAASSACVVASDAPGLVGYWKLDGVFQAVIDETAFQNNGVLGGDFRIGADDPARVESTAPTSSDPCLVPIAVAVDSRLVIGRARAIYLDLSNFTDGPFEFAFKALIEQGATERVVEEGICGDPADLCDEETWPWFRFVIPVNSDTTPGRGTFVPGPAELIVEVKREGILVAKTTAPVHLILPSYVPDFKTPDIDGVLGFGEWDISNRWELENGFVVMASDDVRLYMLIDLVEDSVEDSEDSFRLSFDVDGDRAVTPNVDLVYSLTETTGEMRYAHYLGPGTTANFQAETRSAMARGFGCFRGDGTLAPFAPFACSAHRIWEVAIDLAEIGRVPGSSVSCGLTVVSGFPQLENDLPLDHAVDFGGLLHVWLRSGPSGPLGPSGGIDPDEPIVALQVGALEVTQAIQDRQNTLRLVADKKTVARVYTQVAAIGATDGEAHVFLYGRRDGIDLPGSPLAQWFLAKNMPDRDSNDDFPSFVLPDSWPRGSVDFRALVWQPQNEISSTTITLDFSPKQVPIYWVVPLNTGTAAAPNLPDDAGITKRQDYLRTVFPLSAVCFVRKPWQDVGPILFETRVDPLNALQKYYDSLVIAWAFGVLSSGQEPFQLPEQIFGFTPTSLSGDPGFVIGGASWIVGFGGSGRVAWGAAAAVSLSVMAHEINHNLDRKEDPTWGLHVDGCGAEDIDPNWPFANDDIQETGVDTVPIPTSSVPADTPDLMSYCRAANRPRQWISTYRWKQLYSFFPAVPGGSGSGQGAQVAAPVDVFYISGLLTVEGSGQLDPVLVQAGLVTDTIAPGDFSIEVLDATGTPLLVVPFTASFTLEGENLDAVRFSYRIPAQNGTARIVLKDGGVVLDEVVVSAQEPEVTVVTPNGGELWSGTKTIAWTANDDDGDELTFCLLYTPDDGDTWFPVAAGITGDAFDVDTSILRGGEEAKLRVIATDGFNTVHDDSDGTFTVEEKPPTVSILEPADGSRLPLDISVRFRGDASDAEDEALPEDAFVWRFGDTVFGAGREVIAWLPEGDHDVTLAVTDSDGNEAEDSVSISISGPPPTSPACDFTGGTAGPSFGDVIGGWEFTVTSPIEVLALGLWDEGGDGLASSHDVGLYTIGQTLLTSTSVSVGTAVPSTSPDGAWVFEYISPIVLDPGTYVVAATYANGDTDFARFNATATTASEVTFVSNRQDLSSSLVFPTNDTAALDDGLFGPNLLVRPYAPSVQSLPGDCNQDGTVDLSDVICLLGHLFQGNPASLPCSTPAANLALMDCNQDGGIDLSDAIYKLAWLFQGCPPPEQGVGCIELVDCPQNQGCQ